MALPPCSVFESNPPQHAHIWSSLQIMWSWYQIMLPEECQKSGPQKRLEHLWCPETASLSTAASLEGTERSQKGLGPGNMGSVWPTEYDLPPHSTEWWHQCGHLFFVFYPLWKAMCMSQSLTLNNTPQNIFFYSFFKIIFTLKSCEELAALKMEWYSLV